jgi:hypothetical protein
MKHAKCFFFVMLLSGIGTVFLNAQSTIATAGGDATGSGGSSSFTIGQILYNTISGSNGYVIQGVQQPYEISIVTAIERTDDFNLRCVVYPNPTSGQAKLVFESSDYKNLSFRLYDIKGDILQTNKVESNETVISLENQSSGVYFLHVLKNDVEVKVFKIIKK